MGIAGVGWAHCSVAFTRASLQCLPVLSVYLSCLSKRPIHTHPPLHSLKAKRCTDISVKTSGLVCHVTYSKSVGTCASSLACLG